MFLHCLSHSSLFYYLLCLSSLFFNSFAMFLHPYFTLPACYSLSLFCLSFFLTNTSCSVLFHSSHFKLSSSFSVSYVFSPFYFLSSLSSPIFLGLSSPSSVSSSFFPLFLYIFSFQSVSTLSSPFPVRLHPSYLAPRPPPFFSTLSTPFLPSLVPSPLLTFLSASLSPFFLYGTLSTARPTLSTSLNFEIESRDLFF